MRKFKFTLIAFMAAMMALSFTACSDDDPEPNPNPDPEVNEDNYHFDLFVTVDKHGGMSSKNTTIVHSVNSLATEQGVITVESQTCDPHTLHVCCRRPCQKRHCRRVEGDARERRLHRQCTTGRTGTNSGNSRNIH